MWWKRGSLYVEGGRNISKRKGFGQMWSQRELGPDPSSHVEDRRGSDHTAIYPPDRLGLPPATLVTQTHVSTPAGVPTHMHKYAQAPSPLSTDQRKGAWTSSPILP